MEKNNTTPEIWKPVVGLENLYEVSNKGNVRSLNYKRQGIVHNLILLNNTHGYKSVMIGGKSRTVHRLVAVAFIPNPNNYPQINHKDENKANNCVENLEWCTPKYNINYGEHNEKISRAMMGNKHQAGRVLSAETRKKISDAHKGKTFSAEHRKNMSISHMGIKQSPESRKKKSLALIGIKRSPETRKRMSEAQRKVAHLKLGSAL